MCVYIHDLRDVCIYIIVYIYSFIYLFAHTYIFYMDITIWRNPFADTYRHMMNQMHSNVFTADVYV